MYTWGKKTTFSCWKCPMLAKMLRKQQLPGIFWGPVLINSEVQIPSLASPPTNLNAPLLINLIIALSYALPVLLATAFLTPAECKILSYIQGQKGTNIIGPFGLLQPLEDGVKLFIKEPICPSTSSPVLLITTPIFALLLAISIWAPLPLPFSLADPTLGLLFLQGTPSYDQDELPAQNIPWLEHYEQQLKPSPRKWPQQWSSYPSFCSAEAPPSTSLQSPKKPSASSSPHHMMICIYTHWNKSCPIWPDRRRVRTNLRI